MFPGILVSSGRKRTVEFSRGGSEDLEIFRELPPRFEVGIGVIDVKTQAAETPDQVAERIRKALEVIPAQRLFVLPDCGLLHLPREVAFAKLTAMVEGTRAVRKELKH